MCNIKLNEHCSFNKDLRNLFHKKQKLNNSLNYTEEEKEVLIKEIEEEIYISWDKIKNNSKRNKG